MVEREECDAIERQNEPKNSGRLKMPNNTTNSSNSGRCENARPVPSPRDGHRGERVSFSDANMVVVRFGRLFRPISS